MDPEPELSVPEPSDSWFGPGEGVGEAGSPPAFVGDEVGIGEEDPFEPPGA